MATLDPEAIRLIRREVRKLVWAGIALIGLLNMVALFSWVPHQAAKIAADNQELRQVTQRILLDAGALSADTKRLREDVENTTKDIVQKVDALKRTDVVRVADVVSVLNTLSPEAKTLVAGVQQLMARVYTVETVKLSPGGYGRGGEFSNCPNEGQVVVGVGVGDNKDIRLVCATLTVK